MLAAEADARRVGVNIEHGKQCDTVTRISNAAVEDMQAFALVPLQAKRPDLVARLLVDDVQIEIVFRFFLMGHSLELVDIDDCFHRPRDVSRLEIARFIKLDACCKVAQLDAFGRV